MQIGSYRIENPWILAPMAGVSEMPFRLIAREMGAGAAPTELVSAKGLLGGQQRTKWYLTHSAKETPFWVQIFGGDPNVMAQGAQKAVEQGAQIIDINMGCPVKKVTKSGAGSALLADPKRAAAIVHAIVERTGVPVTVKIRAGWDQQSRNYVELTHVLAEAGAAAIAMHARTRSEGYSGFANWDLISDLVKHSPIPVIGNGDIATAADARRMLEETGCDAVMIGRGALGNPWIFAELTNSNYIRPTSTMRWRTIDRHFTAHLEFIADELRAVRRFRSHLQWYSQGLEGRHHFLGLINKLEEVGAVRHRIEAFFSKASFGNCDRSPTLGDLRGALG